MTNMGKYYLFLLFSFLVLLSCTEENISRDQKTNSTNPTENQVKAFNTVKLALIHYRNNENNFLFAKEKEIPKDSIKWGLARVKLNENGKTILWVPIASELDQTKHYFLYITVNERSNVENIYFGEYDSSAPCCTTYGNKLHLDHLSGTVRIYNTNNEPLGSLVYENGIPKFTKGIGDKIHELAEIIIYPDTFIANWSDWNFYFGSGTTIDTSDLFCPLCGAGSAYLYLDQYQNLFCNMCGYGLGSSGGAGSASGDDGKKPQKKDICSDQAVSTSNKVENALSRDDWAKEWRNDFKNEAKNNKSEVGNVINKDASGNLAFGPILMNQNMDSRVVIQINPNTIYIVHTHTQGGYTGPSVTDIYELLKAASSYPNLEGNIIVSYDGSEYLLSISDRNAAISFFSKSGDLFNSNSNGLFANSGMQNKYEEIYNNLRSQNYSENTSHDYALSFLLNEHNTGLKIFKNDKTDALFGEMNTTKSTNNKYTPSICN